MLKPESFTDFRAKRLLYHFSAVSATTADQVILYLNSPVSQYKTWDWARIYLQELMSRFLKRLPTHTK